MLTRKEWLAALRSGEYAQARGFLYNPDAPGFCCLGVACHLAGASTEELAYEETSLFSSVGLHELWPALGLTDEDCDNLASANDSGASFETIANIIEGKPFKRVNIDGKLECEEPALTDA